MKEREPRRERPANPIGNERLTASAGLLVLAPVAVELVTILLGVHTFMSLHVFVGLALIPPVLLKLGSTGWRFARYYTRSRAYVAHGPPEIAMRMLAPLFVAATVALFGSGVAMGLLHGHALVLARRVHGPASAIWLVLLGVHVLVYLRRAFQSTAQDVVATRRSPVHGIAARASALAATVIAGLALGGATVSAQHRWIDLPRDHDLVRIDRSTKAVRRRAPAFPRERSRRLRRGARRAAPARSRRATPR